MIATGLNWAIAICYSTAIVQNTRTTQEVRNLDSCELDQRRRVHANW